jgi:hypothetical protein
MNNNKESNNKIKIFKILNNKTKIKIFKIKIKVKIKIHIKNKI